MREIETTIKIRKKVKVLEHSGEIKVGECLQDIEEGIIIKVVYKNPTNIVGEIVYDHKSEELVEYNKYEIFTIDLEENGKLNLNWKLRKVDKDEVMIEGL